MQQRCVVPRRNKSHMVHNLNSYHGENASALSTYSLDVRNVTYFRFHYVVVHSQQI